MAQTYAQTMISLGKSYVNFHVRTLEFMKEHDLFIYDERDAFREAYWNAVNQQDFSFLPKKCRSIKTGKTVDTFNAEGHVKWSTTEYKPAFKAASAIIKCIFDAAEVKPIIEDDGELTYGEPRGFAQVKDLLFTGKAKRPITRGALYDLAKQPVIKDDSGADDEPDSKESPVMTIQRYAEGIIQKIAECNPDTDGEAIEAAITRVTEGGLTALDELLKLAAKAA